MRNGGLPQISRRFQKNQWEKKEPRAGLARGLPRSQIIGTDFVLTGRSGTGRARLLMPPCLFSRFYNGEVKAQKHLGSEGNQHAAMKSPGQRGPGFSQGQGRTQPPKRKAPAELRTPGPGTRSGKGDFSLIVGASQASRLSVRMRL
jgi:hypothetical protein